MNDASDQADRISPYHLKQLVTRAMRPVLIAHLDGPQGVVPETPEYASVVAAVARDLLKFDRDHRPRYSSLTRKGRACALALIALEVDDLVAAEQV